LTVIVAALCATGLVGATLLSNASAASRPAVSQLGFYPGYGNVAQLTSLETWLGHDANYVVQFADGNAANFAGSVWGEVTKAGAFQVVSNRTTLVESIPLAFGGFVDATTAAGQATARAGLQATASGANDSLYQQAAVSMRAGGFGDAIIRLGWEFDGGWMPWSSNGNNALWVSAFQHVVNVFRSVSPNFRFDWNGDPGWLQGQTGAYPGDGYVDIIGLDVYDKGLGVAWNSSTQSWADPAAAFAKIVPNLEFQRDFAITHGKQVSYPEWALATGGSESAGNAGGDDPTFIQGMYDWMNSLPASGAGSLAYHSYFNEDAAQDGNHMLSHFPNAQARFKALFGGSSTPASIVAVPTTKAPAPAPAPTTTAPRPPLTTRPTTPTTSAPAPPATDPTTTVPAPPTTMPTTVPPPTEPKPVSRGTSSAPQVIAAGTSATNIATESRWPGAQDAPYICCWGSQGQYVTFSFDSAGGPTNLALRYAAGNGGAARKIELDGSVLAADQTFRATADWSTWSTVSLRTTLTPGPHALKVWMDRDAGSYEYLNLDNLTVSPILVIPAGRSATNIPTESRWSGAQSAPYICCWGTQGQYVTFSFTVGRGPTALSLRYSAGNGPASRKIELDGSVLAADQTFPGTGDWNTWSMLTLHPKLKPGVHTLQVWMDRNAGSSEYMNLDNLWVTGGMTSG
jgi:hypothetical protein